MSTDRELLELAAKAVGFDTTHRMNAKRLQLDPPVDALLVRRNGELVTTGWNPLIDDGDALRLAVKLRLDISPQPDDKIEVSNQWENEDDFRWAWESYGGDAFAATRRAIVRAAAEIGKAMP